MEIYTTPTCKWCDELKAWLKKKKISYAEHDLTDSDTARDELLEKSHQMATPMIDINGTIIVGFKPKEIEKALEA